MQTTVKDDKFKREDGRVLSLCSGVCPVCGSEAIVYRGNELYADYVSFPFICEDCGAEGLEHHSLVFQYSEAQLP